MRWARHISCTGESRGLYRILVGKLEGRRPLGSVGGRIILRWIFRKLDVGAWMAQDRHRWRTLVNVVMNLQVP
jgi:hypothetical protein